MESHILVLSLVSVWSGMACSARLYHFVSQQMNWTDAQAFCKDKFTDLATVDSKEDMARLVQLAKDHGHSGDVWIGLYQDVDSWKWSLNQSAFYGEKEKEYRDWGPGEPNNFKNANGQECCVDIRNKKWNDESCKNPLPFICYDAGEADPYILVNSKVSWEDAQSYCRTHHIDLASVRNASENQLILAKVSESTWISMYRDCLLWRWSDQSRSPFRKWTTSYPTSEGNCAAVDVDTGGDWYERNCDNLRSFVCYREVTQKQIVRMELQMASQVDMSDPDLQAAILQQIEQRLQGLPAEAKLRWIEQTDGQIFRKKN